MKNEDFIHYGEQAVKSLNIGDEQGFFESLGILKYGGHYDYVNILISQYYFIEKNYRKCLENLENIRNCKNENLKQSLTILYWDYKIASLAKMGRFDEIREIFFDDDGLFDEDDDIVMSLSAYGLAKYLSQKAGFEDDEVGIFRPDALNDAPNYRDDKFRSFLFREIGNDLLEIFLQNNELLHLKEAGIEKNIRKELKENLLKKIELIEGFCNKKYFSVSPNLKNYLIDLRKRVSNDREIDKEDLLKMMLSLFTPEIITEDIYNWSFVMEMFLNTLDKETFVNIFQEHKKYVLECLKNKNEIIAKKILIIIQNREIADVVVEGKTFKEFWSELIEKYIPGYTYDTVIYSYDIDIYNRLSDKSKWAYEAAIWQYEQVIEYGTELMDAGLLSLSFMRILEMEFNSRFVTPVSTHIKKDSKGKTLFEKSDDYKFLINSNRGQSLGQLRYYFLGIKDHKSDETRYLYDFLTKEILSDAGKKALDNGDFERITDQNIIDKFRNPPAHSRFLQKSEAIKAKKYTEDSLIKIFYYIN